MLSKIFLNLKKTYSIFWCFLLIIFFFGCDNSHVISNFDENAWKADKLACENTRIELGERIMEAKSELNGLSQQEIISILGNPEKQELYGRGQNFFIYYLSPSPECKQNKDETSPSKKPRLLYVRFSALNIVNEVFIENY